MRRGLSSIAAIAVILSTLIFVAGYGVWFHDDQAFHAWDDVADVGWFYVGTFDKNGLFQQYDQRYYDHWSQILGDGARVRFVIPDSSGQNIVPVNKWPAGKVDVYINFLVRKLVSGVNIFPLTSRPVAGDTLIFLDDSDLYSAPPYYSFLQLRWKDGKRWQNHFVRKGMIVFIDRWGCRTIGNGDTWCSVNFNEIYNFNYESENNNDFSELDKK